MTTIEHDTQQPAEAVEAKTTTALAVVTKSIAEINAVEATIAELEAKYKGVVFQVGTPEGMEEARKARAEIRAPRYALQNIEKATKAIVNDLKTSVSEQVGAYIPRIEAIEDPVHQQIVGEEQRKAAEKKAREEAEAKRVAAVEERISDIRETVTLAAGKPSAVIAGLMADLEAVAIDASFAEFQQRAETAKAATLVRLQAAHKAAVDLEAQQKRLEEERAAQAVERERLAEEQRIAREAAAAEEARLRKEREAQEAAAAQERARIAEEERQARVKREAEEREHQEHLRRQREEEERAAAERRRILEAEERAAQERLAAQRAEADRIEAERKAQREAEEQRLAEQRAELDRQQQALQLEKEAVAPASDPAEATSSESVLPPQPSAPTAHEAAYRPTDDEIIEAVAQAFFVPESTAVDWIAGMEIHQRQAEAA